jgi:hypothetical protein
MQVRANSTAEFVLVLRRSRYSILQHEDNEEGAALMRSIYLDTKVLSLLALLVQKVQILTLRSAQSTSTPSTFSYATSRACSSHSIY